MQDWVVGVDKTNPKSRLDGGRSFQEAILKSYIASWSFSRKDELCRIEIKNIS